MEQAGAYAGITMISVGDIYEDMYNNLWIATTNSGVFSYNTLSGHWKHFQHEREDSTTITSNSVITVFEDNKGVMWFGTNGGGLCSFDPKTEAFIEFDSALPNKVIYSIEQDQTGDFWISSNAGILAESTALMFSRRNVLWIIPTFLRYM